MRFLISRDRLDGLASSGSNQAVIGLDCRAALLDAMKQSWLDRVWERTHLVVEHTLCFRCASVWPCCCSDGSNEDTGLIPLAVFVASSIIIFTLGLILLMLLLLHLPDLDEAAASSSSSSSSLTLSVPFLPFLSLLHSYCLSAVSVLSYVIAA